LPCHLLVASVVKAFMAGKTISKEADIKANGRRRQGRSAFSEGGQASLMHRGARRERMVTMPRGQKRKQGLIHASASTRSHVSDVHVQVLRKRRVGAEVAENERCKGRVILQVTICVHTSAGRPPEACQVLRIDAVLGKVLAMLCPRYLRPSELPRH